MKRMNSLFMLGLAGLASAALAQETAPAQSADQQPSQVTQQEVTTKTTTVQGKVVRYEAGKTIVVVGADGKQTSYTLSPSVVAPSDVQIGRQVSMSTEPSDNGPVTVTRITSQSMTPEGNLKTETQTQATHPNGDQTTTKSTSITGTVSAFQPGQSVTFVLPDKQTVTYSIDSSSVLPSDVEVGKTYTVETVSSTTGGKTVVRKITTKTKTTTNK